MRAADTEVGPARAGARASPQGAPALRLACLLRHAGRRLAVLVLLLATPACIVPLAPEFRDPAGSANARPLIISANPQRGATWEQNTFSIMPSDSNVEDILYLRWVVATVGATTIFPTEEIPPSLDGTPLRQNAEKTFLCPGLEPFPSHQVSVIVADRVFAPNSQNLAEVQDDGLSTTISWTWIAQCPQP